MDAATLGAVGAIIVGVFTAGVAFYGHRGQSRASHAGALYQGYSGLVDQVQEERDKLQTQLAEKETLLAAAYAELAGERAGKAALQAQIAELTTEIGRLQTRIAELEGATP